MASHCSTNSEAL
jgi:hypothetical protein